MRRLAAGPALGGLALLLLGCSTSSPERSAADERTADTVSGPVDVPRGEPPAPPEPPRRGQADPDGGSGARRLAVGWLSACAIRRGELWCWGSDVDAWPEPRRPGPRIVSPAPPDRVRPPTRVEGARPEGLALAVATCVLEVGGRVVCFGTNRGGALGIGLAPLARGRFEVELPAPARDLATLGTRTCARLEGGGAACWGDAQGWEGPPPRPSRVTDSRGRPLEGLARVAVDAAIDSEGRLLLWGADRPGETRRRGPREAMQAELASRPSSARTRLIDVARTPASVCTLDVEGRVDCWGELRVEAGAVAGGDARIPPARELECAEDYCCVATRDGRLVAWAAGMAPRTLARMTIGALALGPHMLCWEEEAPGRPVWCFTSAPDVFGLRGAPDTPIRVPLP